MRYQTRRNRFERLYIDEIYVPFDTNERQGAGRIDGNIDIGKIQEISWVGTEYIRSEQYDLYDYGTSSVFAEFDYNTSIGSWLWMYDTQGSINAQLTTAADGSYDIGKLMLGVHDTGSAVIRHTEGYYDTVNNGGFLIQRGISGATGTKLGTIDGEGGFLELLNGSNYRIASRPSGLDGAYTRWYRDAGESDIGDYMVEVSSATDMGAIQYYQYTGGSRIARGYLGAGTQYILNDDSEILYEVNVSSSDAEVYLRSTGNTGKDIILSSSDGYGNIEALNNGFSRGLIGSDDGVSGIMTLSTAITGSTIETIAAKSANPLYGAASGGYFYQKNKEGDIIYDASVFNDGAIFKWRYSGGVTPADAVAINTTSGYGNFNLLKASTSETASINHTTFGVLSASGYRSMYTGGSGNEYVEIGAHTADWGEILVRSQNGTANNQAISMRSFNGYGDLRLYRSLTDTVLTDDQYAIKAAPTTNGDGELVINSRAYQPKVKVKTQSLTGGFYGGLIEVYAYDDGSDHLGVSIGGYNDTGSIIIYNDDAPISRSSSDVNGFTNTYTNASANDILQEGVTNGGNYAATIYDDTGVTEKIKMYVDDTTGESFIEADNFVGVLDYKELLDGHVIIGPADDAGDNIISMSQCKVHVKSSTAARHYLITGANDRIGYWSGWNTIAPIAGKGTGYSGVISAQSATNTDLLEDGLSEANIMTLDFMSSTGKAIGGVSSHLESGKVHAVAVGPTQNNPYFGFCLTSSGVNVVSSGTDSGTNRQAQLIDQEVISSRFSNYNTVVADSGISIEIQKSDGNVTLTSVTADVITYKPSYHTSDGTGFTETIDDTTGMLIEFTSASSQVIASGAEITGIRVFGLANPGVNNANGFAGSLCVSNVVEDDGSNSPFPIVGDAVTSSDSDGDNFLIPCKSSNYTGQSRTINFQGARIAILGVIS